MDTHSATYARLITRVTDDLAEWAGRRRGVEVYVEPKTAVTGTSVVLVAHDGEFTRRRISSPKAARKFAHEHELPIYDAMIVGLSGRIHVDEAAELTPEEVLREIWEDHFILHPHQAAPG